MFHIEVDRILLEIGKGKSELYNLELYGPDKYEIAVVSNPNNEKDANIIKEELSNRNGPYHQYTFKVFTTENMPKDEIRLILMTNIPHVSAFMPYIPITSVTVTLDEHYLNLVSDIWGSYLKSGDHAIGAKK